VQGTNANKEDLNAPAPNWKPLVVLVIYADV
jgi:hypothetical protein